MDILWNYLLHMEPESLQAKHNYLLEEKPSVPCTGAAASRQCTGAYAAKHHELAAGHLS